ncbi:MAG: alpha/beta hydrolase [Xanthobacteraceae bacterium]
MAIDYEAEYDNRARVKEHPEIFARWKAAAAAYRDTGKTGGAKLNVSYGASPRQIYDFFPSKSRDASAPLATFIHGGFWRTLEPASFSHMARGMNERGIDVAMIGYDLCPNVSLAAIIDQTRAACVALWKAYGKRITAVGHSAGGHLAACMVATDFKALDADVPADLAHIGYALSGVFELEPVLHTSVNNDLKLDHDEAYKMSPVFWQVPTGHVLDCVVGGIESSEFLRQSKVMADAWGGRGVWTRYEELDGANHFTVIDPLTDPDSPMVARIVELTQRTAGLPL